MVIENEVSSFCVVPMTSTLHFYDAVTQKAYPITTFDSAESAAIVCQDLNAAYLRVSRKAGT